MHARTNPYISQLYALIALNLCDELFDSSYIHRPRIFFSVEQVVSYGGVVFKMGATVQLCIANGVGTRLRLAIIPSRQMPVHMLLAFMDDRKHFETTVNVHVFIPKADQTLG